ncbi:putative Agglutinin domain, aerolysin-like toxin, beta complex domain-containing protein [Rosa chinensis]|uniref:Putative Agglutinin domain, aerolysin-like toxin, beta complex domain-containing protein n=1 Tax=Rosa chinensis TaxID=74649 RepID=A0A2P6SCU9_ROSCH|nr:putative Agglutinin domain, aerolysin-like toxin, beta complex domain-containing protein [Rosa chinensis]
MTEVEINRTENPSDETTLPRFVVLKSNNNNKYLSYTKINEENVDQVPMGLLKFSGEEVGSHYAKFEVEMAKSSENQGLVHIRCCHNNKYWVRLLETNTSNHDHWIVARAEEPEEDRSKSSCTLFEPIVTIEELNDPIVDEENDDDAINNGENDDTEQHQNQEVIDTHPDPDVIEHLQDHDATDDPHNNGNPRLDEDFQDQHHGRDESNIPEEHQANELVNHDDDEEINNDDEEDDNNNNHRARAHPRPPRNEMDRKRILVRLRHVQLGHYVGLRRDNVDAQHFMGGLSTSPDNDINSSMDENNISTNEQTNRTGENSNSADDQTNRTGENNNNTNDQTNCTNAIAPCDVFTVINWESLVIFPKHVAFRGDNGVFLSTDSRSWYEGHMCLEYRADDFRDGMAAHEIFTNPDGSIRIKSDYLGKFWCRRSGDPNWVVPDSDNPTRNDTLFQPIKIDENEFALRNMGNFHICKRYTLGCMVGFTANVTNIPIYAHLRIEEIVKSRIVYDVSYNLTQARIYDYENEVEIAIGEAVNLTQETTGMTFKLSYKRTKSTCWNDAKTMSIKSGGVKTTMQAGVPVIGDDEKLVISSSEFTSGSTIFKWGEVETWETPVQSVCRVDVPAMTKLNVSLVANKASYEVPFNYSRRDTRTNGQISNDNDMDDGIYIGFNFYNFKYNSKQKNL